MVSRMAQVVRVAPHTYRQREEMGLAQDSREAPFVAIVGIPSISTTPRKVEA